MPDLVGVRALRGTTQSGCAIGLLRDPAFGSTGSRLSAYERLCLPWFWFFSNVLLIKDSCEGSGLSTIESSQDSHPLFICIFFMKQCCHKSYVA